MLKLAGIALLLVGMSGLAMANSVVTPEIDAGSAVSALALLSGTLLVFRGRRK